MFLGVPILLYIGAAAWRLSNLIAHKEKGPYRIIWKLHLWARKMDRKHAWFKKSEILEGMECEYCNSIWFGIILGLGYRFFGEIVLWAILPLAISTIAIVIKHVVFLIKSVDTRFDQQNQNELKRREEAEKLLKANGHSNVSQWDALYQKQTLEERR